MEKVIDTYHLVKIGNGWYEEVRMPIVDNVKTALITKDYNRAMRLSKKQADAVASRWGGEIVTFKIIQEDN